MISSGDTEYLKRVIRRNEVILFLGAGFSVSAKNQSGKTLPTGDQLCRILWDFLGYSGTWDGTNLQVMYDVALKSRRGLEALSELLNSHLLVKEIPDWYEFLTKVFWRRWTSPKKQTANLGTGAG